jgi:D-threo-aldose 1-dehydrogenase
MPPRTEPLSRRPLGSTGLQVTPLCIGCAPLGNMPQEFAYEVPEERAVAAIRAFFAGPFNFLDTAASYGDGESERRIGIVLRELGGLPPGFILATKADRDLQTGVFTGAQMRRSIERSLHLLGLEQLQLVYLHDPEHISFEEAMQPGGPVEVLEQCKEEGLIAHLGVAGGPIDLMIRFVETSLFEAAISHNRFTLPAKSTGWRRSMRRHMAQASWRRDQAPILAICMVKRRKITCSGPMP